MALPPLETSKVNPVTTRLTDVDLYEAVCLRLEEDTYREIYSGVSFDDDGIPITGDAVVDEWERELLQNGIERT